MGGLSFSFGIRSCSRFRLDQSIVFFAAPLGKDVKEGVSTDAGFQTGALVFSPLVMDPVVAPLGKGGMTTDADFPTSMLSSVLDPIVAPPAKDVRGGMTTDADFPTSMLAVRLSVLNPVVAPLGKVARGGMTTDTDFLIGVLAVSTSVLDPVAARDVKGGVATGADFLADAVNPSVLRSSGYINVISNQ